MKSLVPDLQIFIDRMCARELDSIDLNSAAQLEHTLNKWLKRAATRFHTNAELVLSNKHSLDNLHRLIRAWRWKDANTKRSN